MHPYLKIGIGIFSLVLVIGASTGAYFVLSKKEVLPPVEEVTPQYERETQSSQEEIWVDIGGTVKTPGLYAFTKGARVGEAISRAGGLTSQANRRYVAEELNLSQLLTDQQKIYIPDQSSAFSALTASPDSGASTKVSINKASVSQLDELPGIGQKRASDIIANRPYQTLEEFQKKLKFSEIVFHKLEPLLSL